MNKIINNSYVTDLKFKWIKSYPGNFTPKTQIFSKNLNL